MEIKAVNDSETSWEEINRAECEENSLFDMCSWGEANQNQLMTDINECNKATWNYFQAALFARRNNANIFFVD